MRTSFKSFVVLFTILFSYLGAFGQKSEGAPIIHGVMRTSLAWGDPMVGVYSFPASDPASFTLVYRNAAMSAISGTYHTDGKYYIITKSTGQPVRYNLVPYTITPEWKAETQKMLNMPAAIASNPVDGKLYIVSQNGAKSTVFNTLNTSGAVYSYDKIADIPDVSAMSINVRGEVFFIAKTGELYKFDFVENKAVLVGNTGLVPNGSEPQGTTFDPLAPDKMYWSANLSGNVRGLYEVDTRSGYTELITPYTTKEIVNGAFIFPPSFTAGTPDIVKYLDIVTEQEGSLNGKIQITVPDKTADGVDLEGKVNLSIQINENAPLLIENQEPGSVYLSSDMTFSNGYQKINLIVSNTSGSSNTSSYKIWMGSDDPAGVTKLTLVQNENDEALVSWEMPVGQHGAYLDTENVRYKIIRHIDKKESVLEESYNGTSYTDSSVLEGEMGNYSYTVIPFLGSVYGPAATTNSLPMGIAYAIPFREEFALRADFNRWTINNISGESVVYNWGYDVANGGQVSSLRKTFPSSSEEDCNSWFISPPIKLEKDRSYKISYRTAQYGHERTGKFNVTLGTSIDPASHSEIIATHSLTGVDTRLDFETFFNLKSVPEDGVYYIGFQDISTKDGYQIYIDDVFVEYSDLPSAATDLLVMAAPQGAMKTLISFKAPETTIEGLPLDAITYVNIYRNDDKEPFWTSDEATPGQEFNLSDDNPVNGLNTYHIICGNTSGEGDAATATVFVGIDVPAKVGNLELVSQNNKATLSWTAPTAGANGGYFDISLVKYRVERTDGANVVVVAEALETTTVTDTTIPEAPQMYYYYRVVPYTTTGNGEAAYSVVSRFGIPYDAPFNESFAGAKFTQRGWMAFEMSGNTFGNWIAVPEAGVPDTEPQDNDGGFVTFTSTRSFKGDSIRMVSPAINISNLEAPVLSFWMFHVKSTETDVDRLWVQVAKDDGAYENLVDKAIKVISASNNGWTLYEFDLDKYKGCENIKLGFIGVSDFGYNVNLDNISVAEKKTYPIVTDLAGTSANDKVSLTWTAPIATDILGYNVYRDGQKINNTLITATSYTDTVKASGVYKYRVTVVYVNQESDPSNEVEVTVTISGIEDIESSLVVYAGNQEIVISGVENQNVQVYTIDGKQIYNRTIVSGEERIPAHNGVYIVKIGEKNVKLIVR